MERRGEDWALPGEATEETMRNNLGKHLSLSVMPIMIILQRCQWFIDVPFIVAELLSPSHHFKMYIHSIGTRTRLYFVRFDPFKDFES